METKRRDLLHQFLSRALLLDTLTGTIAQNYIPANAFSSVQFSLVQSKVLTIGSLEVLLVCAKYSSAGCTDKRRGSLLKSYSMLKSEFSKFKHVVGQTLRMKRYSLKQH
jgi:hypothetical protein